MGIQEGREGVAHVVAIVCFMVVVGIPSLLLWKLRKNQETKSSSRKRSRSRKEE